MRRPTINITPAARIVVGVVGTVMGSILLASAPGAAALVLEVLLVLAGLDLAIAGALGHCPLCSKLGHLSPSLRRPT